MDAVNMFYRNRSVSSKGLQMRVNFSVSANHSLSVVFLLIIAVNCYAQNWIIYDPRLGTLPEQQCFVLRRGSSIPAEINAAVASGRLSYSTLPACADRLCNGDYFWERNDVSINFESGFVFECRINVIESQSGTTNGPGWPRDSFGIQIEDDTGRNIWVATSSGRTYMMTNGYSQYLGGTTAPFIPMGLAGQTRDLRITTDAGMARLFIDGVETLVAPLGGPVAAGRSVRFGDMTGWSNSAAEIEYVRFTGVGNGPIVSLSDPASLRICPSATATFDVVAQSSGGVQYLWQYRRLNGFPSEWTSLVDGTNLFAGQFVLNASGVNTPALSVDRSPAVWPTFTSSAFTFRCTATDPCGSTIISGPAEASADVVGDADGNGTVDFADISAVLSAFGSSYSPSSGYGDANRDGSVGFLDITNVLVRFGDSCE